MWRIEPVREIATMRHVSRKVSFYLNIGHIRWELSKLTVRQQYNATYVADGPHCAYPCLSDWKL
jgi:hypothetical protein